ncbi:MAG TPA: FixH family protein [Stenomitos sp.]
MKLTYAQKFVGGMIGILGLSIAVNIGMITLAATSNDGLVTEHYYSNGLRYAEQRAREMDRPGWNVSIEAPTVAERTAPFVVTVSDHQHVPLTGATATLKLYRPTKAGYDQLVPLKETAPGRFEAQVKLPLVGLWDTTVAIEKGKQAYDHLERIRVEAPRS